MADLTAKDKQTPEEGNQVVVKKKPYLRPSFRFERVFVTTALSCGKVSGTELQCRSNTKIS
jgi:hypothetical protein